MAKKQSAPADAAKRSEMKAAKLKELAAKRVPRAITAIRLVGNLGSYKPTEEQSTKILQALSVALKETQARLTGGTKAAGEGFSL